MSQFFNKLKKFLTFRKSGKYTQQPKQAGKVSIVSSSSVFSRLEELKLNIIERRQTEAFLATKIDLNGNDVRPLSRVFIESERRSQLEIRRKNQRLKDLSKVSKLI